ncbi:hypothetical protein C1G87_1439 [Dehalococcoides mccartyi]|uniref:Uncharacterized protein n=1 Tax=Dehalococcoides mccartyi TaxID=61435 RepID=A0A142VBN3_9CHLR|nr:hypothetical protein Dm11a5_1398 [Dehalococcoides mccartyi]RAL68959.1 hypothetical protein C1G87_1439 [Dehalococcoides mccartyi]
MSKEEISNLNNRVWEVNFDVPNSFLAVLPSFNPLSPFLLDLHR